MRQDLVLRTNEDFLFTCRWLAADGTPYPVSAAGMQIRRTVTLDAPDGEILFTAEVQIATPELGGWLYARVPRTVIAANVEPLPPTASYDFVATRGDDLTRVLAEGLVTIKRGITE